MKNNDKLKAVRYNERIPGRIVRAPGTKQSPGIVVGAFTPNIKEKEPLDQKQKRRTGI